MPLAPSRGIVWRMVYAKPRQRPPVPDLTLDVPAGTFNVRCGWGEGHEDRAPFGAQRP